MPAILKLKDSNGTIYTVPALRGKDGKNIKAGKHLLMNESDEMSVDVTEILSEEDGRPIAGNAVKKETDTLREELKQTVRMQTGAYTGTGVYGEANPNTLTFPFTPKFLVLTKETGAGEALFWMEGLPCFTEGGIAVSVTEKTLSFYHPTSAALQQNEANAVYRYTAFGNKGE